MGGGITEYFDLLDRDGQPTGQTKARTAVHRDGDWHRSVQIWVVNDRNEVLLQRRAADKDSYPGLLDISCAGHVVAGETPLEAALSELREELDFTVEPAELQFLGQYRHSSRPAPNFINNCFYHIYLLRRNFDPGQIVFQRSEISEVIALPAAVLKARLQDPRTATDFVPHDFLYRQLFQILGV